MSAALFTWVGGKMDSARGPKPVINLSMWVLIVVCLVIAGMSRDRLLRASRWPKARPCRM